MNITRRPPQGLERQGRTGGYSYQRDWVVVRIDRGFEVTGIEPWTYLLSAGRVDFCPLFGIFLGVKPVALQVVLTLPQQRLHYSPRLLPIPPTYKLNGSSFGRPDVDLMFAKWAFNNVLHAHVMSNENKSPIENQCAVRCARRRRSSSGSSVSRPRLGGVSGVE